MLYNPSLYTYQEDDELQAFSTVATGQQCPIQGLLSKQPILKETETMSVQPMIAYTLGTQDQIVAAMNTVLEDEYTAERIYTFIATKLAGQQKYEHGVRLGFNLYLLDAVKEADLPPQTFAVLSLLEDDFIQAIISTAAKPE